MRKTLVVCLLVLLLSGSAVAGEMPNLTPAPPNAAQEPTGGEIPNDVTDTLTQIALELLAVLF
jgi:hypothetical protein